MSEKAKKNPYVSCTVSVLVNDGSDRTSDAGFRVEGIVDDPETAAKAAGDRLQAIILEARSRVLTP